MVAASEVIEFAIEEHALGVAGDVLLREIHLDIGFESAVVDENLWNVECGMWNEITITP